MKKYEQQVFNIVLAVLVTVVGFSILYHLYLAFFSETIGSFNILPFLVLDRANIIATHLISTTFILTLLGIIPIFLLLRLESEYKKTNILNKRILGSFLIVVVVLSMSASIVFWNSFFPVLPIEDSAPNFQLTDENNNTVTKDTYSGKVLLIDFIYSNCPDPEFCAASTVKMSTVQDKLIALGVSSKDVHLILISFDYIYDGPLQMKNYGIRFGADFSYWSFLSGNKSVLDIATSYGVYTVPPNTTNNETTFIHSLKKRDLETYLTC